MSITEKMILASQQLVDARNRFDSQFAQLNNIRSELETARMNLHDASLAALTECQSRSEPIEVDLRVAYALARSHGIDSIADAFEKELEKS